MTNPAEQLLTIEETAAELKLSKAHLYREVRNNNIPYIRLGRLLRFRRSDLSDYVAGRRVPSVRK